MVWWFMENVLGHVFPLPSRYVTEKFAYVGRYEDRCGGPCGVQDAFISSHLYLSLLLIKC